jgi:hypothetical protein
MEQAFATHASNKRAHKRSAKKKAAKNIYLRQALKTKN